MPTAPNRSPFPPKSADRSPVPDPSLPQAGESLREAAMDIYFMKFARYILMAVMFGLVAAFEWIGIWLKTPVSPWYWTVCALGMGAMALWRWYSLGPVLRQLRQGIRGEREVGRMLEGLRALRYEVFHDIPGNGFNVDHALVGPAGVFAIETKTLTKPAGRKATVDYDGTRVLVDGKAMDRDPVAQAEAGAAHLRDILERTTGRDVDVRPVVLFPGWWVNSVPRGAARVWVLNPKALPAFLRNEPKRLSPEDVALYTDRLHRRLTTDG